MIQVLLILPLTMSALLGWFMLARLFTLRNSFPGSMEIFFIILFFLVSLATLSALWKSVFYRPESAAQGRPVPWWLIIGLIVGLLLDGSLWVGYNRHEWLGMTWIYGGAFIVGFWNLTVILLRLAKATKLSDE